VGTSNIFANQWADVEKISPRSTWCYLDQGVVQVIYETGSVRDDGVDADDGEHGRDGNVPQELVLSQRKIGMFLSKIIVPFP